MDSVKFLNEIFKVYGFKFSFIHYVNEEFQKFIYQPLAEKTKVIKSSPQVKYGISPNIDNHVSETTQQHLRKVAVTDEQLKIGLLVRTEFRKLANTG
ncbi:hypothetical protein ABES02_28205 [Neobacillus pocheonensis]|uniref:hypothetical protein n=1 Tax=Neobacillus pocheonensis TaxID=363869 RepID=UPI003D2904CB